MNKSSLERAEASFGIEARAIEDTRRAMDWTAFARAAEALCRAQRIAASGCGHSGIACRHFAHSMCCVERPARFLSPAEALHGASGYLQRGDVLVLASRGGKTAELPPLAAIARKKGAVVVSVTEDPASPMAEASDIVLPMRVERESDRYNAQGTASFIALSALFDALQVAVMEETGYRPEQFALIHPGGAVGRRLNEGG